MKKAFSFLAFALMVLAMNAQQPRMSLQERLMQHHPLLPSVKNGTDYSLRFDSLCYELDGIRRVEKYSYDEHANVSSKVTEINEYGSLVDGYKQEFEYDECNRCIKETEYLYDDYDGEWEKEESVERSYDANGNLLMETYMDWPFYGEKQLWTYDFENRISVRELWKYDSYDDIWYPDIRNEYTYDTNGNLILLLTKDARADGQTWVDAGKLEYVYDTNSNMLQETTSIWYSDLNEWRIYRRYAYGYDANNNLIQKINFGSSGMTGKTEYTYNESNMPILIVSFSTTDQGNTWMNVHKEEYEYDQNDSVVLMATFSGEGNTWRKDYKYEYERNGHGFVTSKTYSYADGYPEFHNCTRRLYDYDERDRLVCETLMEWDEITDILCNVSKTVCTFDQNGNVTEISVFYDCDGEWELEESVTNTYDLSVSAENILGLYSIYDEIFIQSLYYDLFDDPSYAAECMVHNKWLTISYFYEGEEMFMNVYYSDYYDVDENESASLKVFSSEGTLTVENDTVADIQVFDMLGRLVAQQNQVAQCKFNLKPGVYVVKAGNASVKAVVK